MITQIGHKNHPRDWIIVFLCCLIAIVVRLILSRIGALPFNSDEAIVALMARHINQGELPIFFYGQAYMGSLDAILVAGGFRIFGEQVWVIRLIQSLLFAGTMVTTFLLARDISGRPKLALLSVVFLTFPVVNVWLYTSVSLGGYGEALLIGNLILLTGLALAQNRAGVAGWVFLGFLIGLGFWAFGLTLVFSGAVFLFFLFRHGPTIQKKLYSFTLAFIGILFGAFPVVYFVSHNGWGQLIAELTGGAINNVRNVVAWQEPIFNLINLVLFGTPVIFGIRPPWEIRWLVLPLIPFVLAAWALILVVLLRRNLLETLRKEEGIRLLVILSTLLCGGFVLSGFGADPTGRYFLPLTVPMAIGAAYAINSLKYKQRVLPVLLVILVLGYNTMGLVQSATKNPPGLTTQFDPITWIDTSYQNELINFLLEQGETHGYSNYWVAYPTAFVSGERVIFVPSLPYHQDFRYTERDNRYAPYQEEVANANQTAYITTFHPDLDTHLRQSLRQLSVTWQEHKIGDYQIFYNLSRSVSPNEMGLGQTITDWIPTNK